MSRGFRLPSPALVISIIALTAAVGGGTFAIAALNGDKVKEIARNQANKVLEKKGPDLSVAHANTAGFADSADVANAAGKANNAFSTFHDDGIHLPSASSPIGTLNVSEGGRYVIFAKLIAENVGGTKNLITQCTLSAGSDEDVAIVTPASGDAQMVMLQVVHVFDTPGSVVLQCGDSGSGDVEVFNTKITAMEVAKLSNTGF
jgi:hypothetical protein